jgi:hypothetical protein
MRIASALIIGFLVFGTIRCGGKDAVSKSISGAVKRGDGARVDLVEHTSFAWDKVCIFGPYIPADRIEAVTGIPGTARDAHGIESRDDIDVLLFARGGRTAASVAHPRNRGDFGPEVVDKCYSKEQAVFAVRKPPAGSWGTIGPNK